MARGSRFGQTREKKWTGSRNSSATLAGKTLRGRRFAGTTVRATTPSFSKTLMATNSKFAAVRSRYSLVDVNTEIKDHKRREPEARPRAEGLPDLPFAMAGD